MSKNTIKSILAAVGAISLAFSTVVAAEASPRVNEKVTICHRTHATTNPYRKITVSMSAVIGSGNSGNGHGNATQGGGQDDEDVSVDHSHNPYYTAAGAVFNPTFDYPSNHKQWQDIIPPFNYVARNGDTGTYEGLNWSAIGKAIYYGYKIGDVDYSGLCSKMSAKQFADKELASNKADNPGYSPSDENQFKRDIKGDLREQESEEDGSIGNGDDLEDLPDPEQPPQGPIVPEKVKDLGQAIAGVVWLDANRNGIQEDSERTFKDVQIKLKDPISGDFYTGPSSIKLSSIGIATTTALVVYTDIDGYFHIDNVPEGDWTVQVVTPSGYVYTYDSNGSGDGSMPGTYVPSGGVGFAWAGLVADPNSSNSGGASGGPGGSLANTGSEVPYGTLVFGVLLTLAGGYVVSRKRR